MEKKVFSLDGKDINTIDLDDRIFGIDISEGSIYHAVKNELANLRLGTASVKNRSKVSASNIKPWKQKGTGRARVGDRKTPLWRGGGVIFGPSPRDYSYKLPKKVKRLAFKSVLSLKARDDFFKVLENFTIESGKTKDLSVILKRMSLTGRTVLLLPNDDQMLKRAGNNIKDLRILSYNRMRVIDLFYAKNILALEGAIKELNSFYLG